MKIKFLGTSHGVPMPGRNYQSMMIEAGDKAYIFDAGAPVMEILINEGYDLTKVKNVFVTHLHSDHILGLVNMVNLGTWYYTNMAFDVYLPEERAVPVIKNFCHAFSHTQETDRIVFHTVSEGPFFDDGNVKITAYHTSHMQNDTDIAFGYLVEAEGKKIYITGDMHPSLKDFNSEVCAMPLDLFISECAHFPAEKILEKIENTGAKQVAFVHVFPVDKYDTFKEYAKTSKYKMLLPNDLDEYII